jgi:predicted methyltransferase
MPMRHLVMASVVAALLASCMDSSPMHRDVSANDTKAYAAAVADPSRPAADSARDVDRKPAETLAFAHIRAGDKVGEFAAGGGYFTRLLVDVVGPKGHVYATELGSEALQRESIGRTAKLRTEPYQPDCQRRTGAGIAEVPGAAGCVLDFAELPRPEG